MAPRVNVALLGEGTITWPLGDVTPVAESVRDVAAYLAEAARSSADAVLLWDAALGQPEPEVVAALLTGVADVYHAGLCLGQAGLPRCIEFIEPVWMHGADAPADRESTSWRVTFRACLVRTSVLTQMRGPCSEFHSLDTAALEVGFHWLRRGVFVRHTPCLVPNPSTKRAARLDAHDELLFAFRCFGRSWMLWAAARGVATGAWSPAQAGIAIAAAARWSSPTRETFSRERAHVRRNGTERVSILIPTIERYPYLRVLLAQLARQTVAPHEVIVVDQTPSAERDPVLRHEFSSLPLRWITLDHPGQCSSRNEGLRVATGDFVLFIDDDDEVPSNLLELHLDALARFGNEVSCGVAHEDGIPALPENFQFMRASDVFPTNNTMIRRSLLERTGLFDLAFDRQSRADADLGMRAHLSGAFMVLDPEIAVLHHHAPRGGLRKHGARVVTYASSRSAIWQRHLPSPSELYLAGRYFGDGPAREVLWQRTLGTFSSHGSIVQRFAKVAAGALLLPSTVQAMRAIRTRAGEMLSQRQEIPTLGDDAALA